MTFANKSSIALFITAVLFCLALIIGTSAQYVEGANSGLPATIATTSVVGFVSGTAKEIFATSTCASRIISTASTSVMLTFSNYANQTPTATFGFFQNASTTVNYDADEYGCGLVKAYPFNSGAITISESR